jgi:hypothetical protein
MATKDEILSAVQIVREFADNPTVGVVKELLDDLEASVSVKTEKVSTAKEVRVVDIEETR